MTVIARSRRRPAGPGAPTPAGLLVLSLALLLLLPPAAAFSFLSSLLPRRLIINRRDAPVPAATTTSRIDRPHPFARYAVQPERQEEEKQEEEKQEEEEESPSLLEQPLPMQLATAKEEIAAGAVASMAMWEVIRELNRRKVGYNVLQPREELDRLLLDARLGGGVVAAKMAAVQHQEDEGHEQQMEAVKTQVPIPPPPAAPAPTPIIPAASIPIKSTPAIPAPAAAKRSSSSSRFRPPPALAAATAPVFGSIADALAWAGKLSEEEIRVELDFLSVTEDTSHLTYSELARLLARSVLIEGGAGRREDRSSSSSSSKRPPPTPSAATSTPPPPPTTFASSDLPTPPAKSKARQNRLLQRQQQHQQQATGSVGRGGGGEEEHPHLDIDHAREELTALRSRALDAVAAIGGSPEKTGTGKSSGRPSSSSAAAGARSSRSGGGGGGKRPGSKARSPQEAWLNDAYDGARFSEGGDLALRLFEKATRTADKAIDFVARAKNSAKGAMIAASISNEDTTPPGKGGKGEAYSKKAALQKKSQKLLGPRGRRWSKLTGLMARAWAESAWQVVMASASWAGGGLLPGKYVLLGAGAFALLLRQGLGTYMATLLVVRTCSSTLRNMIEDDDDELEGAGAF